MQVLWLRFKDFLKILGTLTVIEGRGLSNIHDLIRVVKVMNPPVRLVRAVRVVEQWLTSRAVGELHVIIINIRGQIENRPLENTRFAGRK